jgi:hypothetical protein
MIPSFMVGAPSLNWTATANPNLAYYKNVVGNLQGMASIAPDQIGGLRLSFGEIASVIEAAYSDARAIENGMPAQLDYVMLGYSEAYYGGRGGPYGLIYGTSRVDSAWMNPAAPARPRDESDLVVASIAERIEQIRDIGGALSNTQLMVWADLYDPQYRKGGNFPKGDVPIPETVNKAKAAGLAHDLVFVQWQYALIADDGRPYDFTNAFHHFVDQGFRLIITSVVCSGSGIPSTPRNRITTCLPALVEAVTAANDPGDTVLAQGIVGFCSAHWDQDGYDDDPCWNTMEYMAYLHGVVAPAPRLVMTPGSKQPGMPHVPSLLVNATEVTQGEYMAIMHKHPFYFFETAELDRPAENVTWYDAILYCNARSRAEGLDTIYTYTVSDNSPRWDGNNCHYLAGVTQDTSKNGYRLPTEDEWECLYSAGTATRYYWGSLYDGDYAWTDDNADRTQPVGEKLPNKWGLHDMAGNVEEMTWTGDGRRTPQLKGGCYAVSGAEASSLFTRTGGRALHDRSHKGPSVGFRVVRKAPLQETPPE